MHYQPYAKKLHPPSDRETLCLLPDPDPVITCSPYTTLREREKEKEREGRNCCRLT